MASLVAKDVTWSACPFSKSHKHGKWIIPSGGNLSLLLSHLGVQWLSNGIIRVQCWSLGCVPGGIFPAVTQVLGLLWCHACVKHLSIYASVSAAALLCEMLICGL